MYPGSKKEKLLWMVFLLSALSFAGYLSYTYCQKYLENDVRTEVRIVQQETLPYPSLTFCFDIQLKLLFSHYWLKLAKKRGKKQWLSISHSDLSNGKRVLAKTSSKGDYCIKLNADGKLEEKSEESTLLYYSYSGYSTLRNDSKAVCGNKRFHCSRSCVFPKCARLFAFVREAKLEEALNLEYYWVELNKTRKLQEQGGYLAAGSYSLILEKVVTKRLPAPYPSKCRENHLGNVFSTRYTRSSCIESCYFYNMLNKCGDVISKWKPFVTKDMRRRKRLNSNLNKIRK